MKSTKWRRNLSMKSMKERTILENFPKKIIRLSILKEHQWSRRRASIRLFISLLLVQTQSIVNIVLLLKKYLSFYCFLKPILMS